MSASTSATRAEPEPGLDDGSLVPLLGEQRAAIVEHLRRGGEATISELADHLGISEVATRRHVGLLEDDDFVTSRTRKAGRGRPAAHYELTDRGRGLYPDRYADVAAELIEFITSEDGRAGFRRYLRWRLERQSDRLAEAVDPDDELGDRLEQLADALSAAGYDASVTPDGEGFELRQHHCAVYEVARHHPEMCAYEAASFARTLGTEVTLSRRQTLAEGAEACVCSIRPRSASAEG